MPLRTPSHRYSQPVLRVPPTRELDPGSCCRCPRDRADGLSLDRPGLAPAISGKLRLAKAREVEGRGRHEGRRCFAAFQADEPRLPSLHRSFGEIQIDEERRGCVRAREGTELAGVDESGGIRSVRRRYADIHHQRVPRFGRRDQLVCPTIRQEFGAGELADTGVRTGLREEVEGLVFAVCGALEIGRSDAEVVDDAGCQVGEVNITFCPVKPAATVPSGIGAADPYSALGPYSKRYDVSAPFGFSTACRSAVVSVRSVV